jgi:hypothetical protein
MSVAMNTYKFLHAGRVGPFSGFAWPDAEWVDADGPPELCRSGIHACRLEHLAYWLADELWRIELHGELVETDFQVIAARGRLVERVSAWDEDARRELAAECVRRTATYAAAELREQGLAAEADALLAADLAEIGARAEEAAAAAGEVVGAGDAVDLAGYVADAAAWAERGHAPGVAFIAAHAADVHAPPGIDDPFGVEREEQSRWLAARLGLSSDGV